MSANRAQWQADADVLARVGQFLFAQPVTVTVRLTEALADEAVAAWQRDDDGEDVRDESLADKLTRHHAGMLALIGLAVEERGQRVNGGVVVELSAWEIGTAFDAAEQRDLLAGVIPPRA